MTCLIIEYNKLCGGWADRILGLVSGIILAKYLNKKFFIKWDFPNINPWFNIQTPWLGKLPPHIVIDTINNPFKYFHVLSNTKNIWQDENIILKCNQNLAEFIYLNPYYKTGNYIREVKDCYRQVFTHYLIPKFEIQSPKRIVQYDLGIQIRTGDLNMQVGRYKPLKSLIKLLENIKEFFHLYSSQYPLIRVYICADYHILELFREYISSEFPCIQFEQNLNSVYHFERSTYDPLKLEAFFQEFFTAIHCSHLIISSYSSHGRLLYILNENNHHWSFNTLGKIAELTMHRQYLTKYSQLPKIPPSLPLSPRPIKPPVKLPLNSPRSKVVPNDSLKNLPPQKSKAKPKPKAKAKPKLVKPKNSKKNKFQSRNHCIKIKK